MNALNVTVDTSSAKPKKEKAVKAPKAPMAVPSNLAYARAIEPTEGAFYAIAAGEGFKGISSLFCAAESGTYAKAPVRITTTTVRGTISHYLEISPQERLNLGAKAINAANIATIERAILPADAEYLNATFSVRFDAHATEAVMHNHPEFTTNLDEFVKQYRAAGGFAELGLRYLLNIANASWMSRNRYGDEMQIRMELKGSVLVIGETDIDMSEGFTLNAILDEQKRAVFASWVGIVADALSGKLGRYTSATIRCASLVRMGAGAEVYPSQEFLSQVTDKADDSPSGAVNDAEPADDDASSDDSASDDKKSKKTKDTPRKKTETKIARVLSKNCLTDGTQIATLHARKINNAIRTIDTWHGVAGLGPIAVDVFGADTHKAVAHRVTGNDLYSYLENPVKLTESLKDGITGVHHFVMACLIRGGVYGMPKGAK